MATLSINTEGLRHLREEYGISRDKELALRISVDKGTVSRVLKGKSAPGPSFVAGLLLAFPVKFEDVFDAVDTTDTGAAA